MPPLLPISLSLSVPVVKVNDFMALRLHAWLWEQSVLKMKWYKLSFMLPRAVLYIRQDLHWTTVSLCQQLGRLRELNDLIFSDAANCVSAADSMLSLALWPCSFAH